MVPLFLRPERTEFSLRVIRRHPVTTQLQLTPRELTTCVTLLGDGYTLVQALEHIQQQRARTASLPIAPEAA